MSNNYIWKTFCNTENKWIETIGTIKPTYCINGIGHSVNGNTIQQLQHTIINTRTTNTAVNTFGENRIVERTPLIDLKSFYGVSPYRNSIGTTGNATVTNIMGTESEINLSVTGSDSTALLKSRERGQYMAGSSSEVGIALRIESTLSANETIKFGYYDENDGYYFKLTGTELSCCIMNNNTEIVIHRDSFNIDKADGTTNSLFNLDMLKGNIFHIDFTWYGYGSVIFSVMGINNLNTQDKIELHRYDTHGQTSTNNPHLPISVELSSTAGSTGNYNVYVGGRQYSIIGQYKPSVRYNSFYKYNKSVNDSLSPIISLKKISMMKPCRARITSIKVNTSVDVEIIITFDAILNTYSYIVPTNTTETSVNQDTSASSLTGGFIIWSTIVFAGNGTVVIDIPDDFKNIGTRPTTIQAKSLGLLGGTISIVTTVGEHW